MTLRDQVKKAVPNSSANFGVVLTIDGQYDPKSLPAMTPKTLRVAILQAVEYEQNFGGRAFVVDMTSFKEVHFDHVYPFTIRGSFGSGDRHHILSN